MYDRMLETVGKEFIEQCFKETGVTPEDIRSVMEQNVYGEKQMCFQKCLSKKIGILESDGRINIDYIKVFVNLFAFILSFLTSRDFCNCQNYQVMSSQS